MTYLGIGSPIPTLKTLRETTVTLNYPVNNACKQDGTVTPSIKNPAGGTFSATPSTGLTIDSGTGVITPNTSTVGTYTVLYTASGSSASFTFQIVADKASGFNYGGSNLQKTGYATPTFDSGVQTGGTFTYSSSTGGTLSITQNSSSADNGKIDLSNSTIGTYSISYASPSPCSTTTSITINVVAVSVDLIANNYALEFNGVDDYIETDFSLGTTSVFSVSMWVKTTSLTTSQILIDNRDVATDGFNCFINTNGTLTFRLNNVGDSGGTVSTSSLSAGTWFHLGLTYDGSSRKIYFNGSKVSEDSITTTLNVTNTMKIGTVSHTTPSNFFSGDIDEVAVWNRSLALEDVQRIYNATANNPGKTANLFTAGLDNGLVYWNRMGD